MAPVTATTDRSAASGPSGRSGRSGRSAPAAPGDTVPVRRRRFGPRDRRDHLVFLALVLPNVALIITFTYRPLIQNIQYSTLNYTLGAPTARVVGLQNYITFFTSSDASQILLTTLVFTVVTVGGSMGLGLLIALGLNKKIPGAGFAQAAVFSPFVLSGVGVGLAWVFIFDPTVGALGAVLRSVGLSSPQWFNDPHLSLVMVCIVYIWKNMGYAAVIYLAGLQAISRDVLEAAAIDGANARRMFWAIKLPLLSPTTFFLLVTSVLNSLQAFDLIKAMTPTGRGTNTLIYESYLQAFGGYNRAGYSATISTILFVILVVFTLVQLTLVERRVHYT